jgi:glycine cleavage system transcriptional repressor
MTQRWVVTALGKDRPGIVAGVTKTLYQLGCNLEDSAMTRLEGEFTVMLIVSIPRRVGGEGVRKALEPLGRKLKLAVYLKPLTRSEAAAPRRHGRVYLISVYGADRPGIVFHISDALARAGINITDVHAHRSTGSSPSLYLLLLEIEVPPARSIPVLERHLKRIAKRLGVEVSLRPSEAAVL